MNPEELIGMRSEDLTEDERQSLASLLDASPEAREEAGFADTLGAILRDLAEDEGGPTLEQLTSPRAANGRWLWGAAALMAASFLGFLLLPGGEDVRSRGAPALPAGSVSLAGVASGPGGVRPIEDGRVRANERVVFWVTARVPGSVVISEVGTGVIHPTSGVWEVAAGEHTPGGASPLSWRPDDSERVHAYRVELCDADGACQWDTLQLIWEL